MEMNRKEINTAFELRERERETNIKALQSQEIFTEAEQQTFEASGKLVELSKDAQINNVDLSSQNLIGQGHSDGGNDNQSCEGDVFGIENDGLEDEQLKSGDEGTRSSICSAKEKRKRKVKVGPSDFEVRAVIGQGAYGRVLQVVQKKTKEVYAMKIIQKGQVLKKNNVSYVREERNILTKVDHPFVINLKCAFQTERKLYLVMEYACGGELFNHLRNEGLFMEQTAAFYTAEIILALEYLHHIGIIHRDLKPENVLLDDQGHVRVTDFGLAKVQENDSQTAKTICGTDLYMAPEMLGGNGYGRAVDYWSLGTLLFEMLTGDPPFFAKDTKKLYKKIMSEKPKFPRWISTNCVSVLKGLLTRNVDQRLGAAKSTMFKTRGVQELKSQKMFSTIDWNKLYNKEVKPPFTPTFADGSGDTSNFDEKFTKQKIDGIEGGGSSPKYKHYMDKAPEDAFAGFSYVRASFLEALMSPRPLSQNGNPQLNFENIDHTSTFEYRTISNGENEVNSGSQSKIKGRCENKRNELDQLKVEINEANDNQIKMVCEDELTTVDDGNENMLNLRIDVAACDVDLAEKTTEETTPYPANCSQPHKSNNTTLNPNAPEWKPSWMA